MLDAEPLPDHYDVDECVGIPVDPTTLFVYWEVRRDTVEAMQRAVPGATLCLRVVAVAPSWDGPVETSFDQPVDAWVGDWFFRGLPAGSIARAAIGWTSRGSFVPVAHSPALEAAPEGASPIVADVLVRWTPAGLVPVKTSDRDARPRSIGRSPAFCAAKRPGRARPSSRSRRASATAAILSGRASAGPPPARSGAGRGEEGSLLVRGALLSRARGAAAEATVAGGGVDLGHHASPSASSPDLTTHASPTEGRRRRRRRSLTDGATVDGSALRARHRAPPGRRRLSRGGAREPRPASGARPRAAAVRGRRPCPTGGDAHRPQAQPGRLRVVQGARGERAAATTASAAGRADPEFVRGVVRCLTRAATRWRHDRRGLGRQARRLGAPRARVELPRRWRPRSTSRSSRSTTTGSSTIEGDQPGKPLALSGMAETRVPGSWSRSSWPRRWIRGCSSRYRRSRRTATRSSRCR